MSWQDAVKTIIQNNLVPQAPIFKINNRYGCYWHLDAPNLVFVPSDSGDLLQNIIAKTEIPTSYKIGHPNIQPDIDRVKHYVAGEVTSMVISFIKNRVIKQDLLWLWYQQKLSSYSIDSKPEFGEPIVGIARLIHKGGTSAEAILHLLTVLKAKMEINGWRYEEPYNRRRRRRKR